MASTVQSAPARRKVSRDDVVRLGRSERPWVFLPVAAQVLRVSPDDHLLRLLLASNLTALGLGTPASELLAMLPETVRMERDVVALKAKIDQLASDRISPDELIAVCRANLDAISHPIEALTQATPRWEEQIRRWQWMRSADGNVVRRETGSCDLVDWIGVGDQIGATRVFSADYFETEEDSKGPLTIEGIDPPWILREALRVFDHQADGYLRRIRVVQADPMEMLDGLAQLDLTEALSTGQVELFAGEGCSEMFREGLMDSVAYRVRGPYVPLASLRKSADPSIKDQISEVQALQQAKHETLHNEMRSRYASRDTAWWRTRYEDALTDGKPLRVLVPTCRYSTFIQHSSRDLVEAIRQAGHEAELLIEPDNHTQFSSLAYLQMIEMQDPDLVILINYTRSNMGHAIPDGLPHVTWIQDAMPQLFDRKIGSSMGRFDFLAGHLLPELFSKFEYPHARLIDSPLVVSSNKFHPGGVSQELRSEHTCEIAFVSHHSESPQQMHERLKNECFDNPRLRGVMDDLYDDVCTAVANSSSVNVLEQLREASEQRIRCEMSSLANSENLTRFLRVYCMPMADRIIRHETLHWACELAEQHGWRLHLYGRGWENSSDYSKYARGELAHGEALRASYQSAAVHLHMSGHTLVHQRVMECALSGGMPLCRLMLHDLRAALGWAHRAAAMRTDPTTYNEAKRWPAFEIADHPELMSIAAQYQRLGLPYRDVGSLSKELLRTAQSHSTRDANRHNAVWLLGDLEETTFRSRDDLERLVLRAIDRPAWRGNITNGIAERVKKETTYGALFSRITKCVRGSFDHTSG